MFKFCWNFDHHREIAELKGKLTSAAAERIELRERLNAKEKELSRLLDWLLTINGAPAINDEHRREPIEKKMVDPYHSTRNARDFQRISEELENKALGPIDLARKS